MNPPQANSPRVRKDDVVISLLTLRLYELRPPLRPIVNLPTAEAFDTVPANKSIAAVTRNFRLVLLLILRSKGIIRESGPSVKRAAGSRRVLCDE
jgi:hypothetical protein